MKKKLQIRCKMNYEHLKICDAEIGDNLLEILRRNQLFLDAPCGGKGICGKCKVQVLNPAISISEEEKHFLSEYEIENNFVLACFHTVCEDMQLNLVKIDNHRIVADFMPFELDQKREIETEAESYGFAIDIGTTTLVIALVNLKTQKIVNTYQTLNPQKPYGADVISRIQYDHEHKDQVLTKIIRLAIHTGLCALIEEHPIIKDQVKEVVISGNTTMIYFLLGLDPYPLSVSPFTTIDLKLMTYSYEELIHDQLQAIVTILPGISAFVGADILSGIYAVNLLKQKDNVLFIDIGTNGEIALKTSDQIYTASTAAGPAFEGANIQWGMGSVSGAICKAKWLEFENKWELECIGDEKPMGICGSGLIDLVAEIKKQKWMDTTGRLENGHPISICKGEDLSDIFINQEDIRQVQLAKSAIASGIHVLLEVADITFEEVESLFIAGGFGKHLSVQSSVEIGLIPDELKEKVVVIGNSSLAGAVKYLLERESEVQLEEIKKHTEYIELSSNPLFFDYYMQLMGF